MIAIVDYGAGNLRSISRALASQGAEAVISGDPRTVGSADAVILPGVGNAGHAMDTLGRLGLIDPLRAVVRRGSPMVGVCLGMQLLFGHQEEGGGQGLGFLPGRVRRLAGPVKVPHMGWNRARMVRDGQFGEAGDERDYYFVHSYVVEPDDPADVLAETTYGEAFPSIVGRDNVVGFQFHPEKSGAAGLALLAVIAAGGTGFGRAAASHPILAPLGTGAGASSAS
ncbi:MAG: Imidazole glycerol phosphate synthase amidotransferase subunit [uncultured Thermomicrobiales bacterium]|uniref:Imidazole glycerol phosphate synthase subunit HisH n=1 Tax=uncultured Thermomicrobiales bacterium TaxID=1645740 RepID=A0A6J4UKQ2_9BACT|nr:MAG: Imidazole glycerol phosphate synthase amidotransferase subunit [uncultured Thermomicrobiales bacterium]